MQSILWTPGKSISHLNFTVVFLQLKKGNLPRSFGAYHDCFYSRGNDHNNQPVHLCLSCSVKCPVVERRQLWRDFSHGWAVIRLKTSSNSSCFYGDFLCRKCTADSLSKKDMFSVYFQRIWLHLSVQKNCAHGRMRDLFCSWAQEEILWSKITVPWTSAHVQKQLGAVSLTTAVVPQSKELNPSGVFSLDCVK